MADAPEEIRTERLLLRRPTADDLDAALEIHADPETNVHNPLGPANPERMARDLRTWRRHWAQHGFGYWAISEAGDRKVIGFGGLRHHVHDGRPALNLYYRFRPSAWGRGYATEMARAALGWATRAQPGRLVVIMTTPDNGPSNRMAHRLDFRFMGTVELDGVQTNVYDWTIPDAGRRPGPGADVSSRRS
ncbi:GNAT family acetyltransferase [Longimycelium tulufanense]|uniref:GNAT family acetyltransferase n=1 Tax=Longimycelium tulufanense TaxID=907463 RepID=A0A8J3C8T9_9PSEU|nr:GNAT family N-acetyltransferase [Longimycelium tulufanense]GGM35487.1 GNAT family acetyltransferase [Longimycelium tulufanense]